MATYRINYNDIREKSPIFVQQHNDNLLVEKKFKVDDKSATLVKYMQNSQLTDTKLLLQEGTESLLFESDVIPDVLKAVEEDLNGITNWANQPIRDSLPNLQDPKRKWTDQEYLNQSEQYYKQKYLQSINVSNEEREFKKQLNTEQGEHAKRVGKERKEARRRQRREEAERAAREEAERKAQQQAEEEAKRVARQQQKELELKQQQERRQMDQAHAEALKMNKEFDRKAQIDQAHAEALEMNKEFDIQQSAKSNVHHMNELPNSAPADNVKDLLENYYTQTNNKEALENLDDIKQAAEKERYINREKDLTHAFSQPEFLESYVETTNADRAKEVAKETIPMEEFDQKIADAQKQYDDYINSSAARATKSEKKAEFEKKKKELHNNLLEQIQEKENHQRWLQHEEKMKQYRAANPEKAIELDTKRAETRHNWTKENVTAQQAEKSSLKQTEKAIINEMTEESAEQVAKNLKKSSMKNLGHLGNAFFAINDFKDAKEAGKSNAGALLHAGAEFAKGEIFGLPYMAVMLAKSVPSLAVSAAEGLSTMTRSMNSTQRRQLFGDSQFMDTQQLATMRQSGMELAKMSQYNLQQTLMGSEAEYLHRL